MVSLPRLIQGIFFTGMFRIDALVWGSIVLMIYTSYVRIPAFVAPVIEYLGTPGFFGYMALIVAAMGFLIMGGIGRIFRGPAMATGLARVVLFEEGRVTDPNASWWAWPRYGVFWLIVLKETLGGLLWAGVGVWALMAWWGEYVRDFIKMF